MFRNWRRRKASAVGAAAANGLLAQLRSVERESGHVHFGIEKDPYSIGFLVGYGLTAGNFAVEGRLEPEERNIVMKHIITTLFHFDTMEVANEIVELHNSHDRAYHDGLTIGGKTTIVSAGLSLKDDDAVYIKAKSANEELVKHGMADSLGGTMLDLYFFSVIDDKRKIGSGA